MADKSLDKPSLRTLWEDFYGNSTRKIRGVINEVAFLRVNGMVNTALILIVITRVFGFWGPWETVRVPDKVAAVAQSLPEANEVPQVTPRPEQAEVFETAIPTEISLPDPVTVPTRTPVIGISPQLIEAIGELLGLGPIFSGIVP